MPVESAGILVYLKTSPGQLEVMLAHPGGPYFANKDEGSWTIPKGLPEKNETLIDAAIRELKEETGMIVAKENLSPLDLIKQKGGKIVHAWAAPLDEVPVIQLVNYFEMEWPPGSGKKQSFLEIDQAEFFDLATARKKIITAQLPFLERLIEERI